MPPDERQRRSSFPPVPPAGTEARLAVLERGEEHQREIIAAIKEDLDGVGEGISSLRTTVDGVQKQLASLAGHVEALLEKRKFWQKVQVAVLAGLCLTLFGFLMKISYIVQSAKVP